MGVEEFFAERWPVLSGRLRGRLARAGVPEPDRDDVLQETALRLVRHWPYVNPDTVDALAHTTAMNVWRDRRSAAASRREVVGEPADVPAAEAGTEAAAISRDELRRVLTALPMLPEQQRELVVGAAAAALDDAAPARPRSAAERMAVMRARQRLVLLVRTVRGFGLALAFRWRPRRRTRGAILLGGAGAVALALVLLPGESEPGREAAAPPPVKAPHASVPRDPDLPGAGPPANPRPAAPPPAPVPFRPVPNEAPPPDDGGDPPVVDLPDPPTFVLPAFTTTAGGRDVKAGVVESPNGPRPCVSGFPEIPVDTSCGTMAKG